MVPLVSDIKKIREEVFKIAQLCCDNFKKNAATQNDYKNLCECILALLIVFNRKRVGDVQYLTISDYKNDKGSK
jgi:hypothetical protein